MTDNNVVSERHVFDDRLEVSCEVARGVYAGDATEELFRELVAFCEERAFFGANVSRANVLRMLSSCVHYEIETEFEYVIAMQLSALKYRHWKPEIEKRIFEALLRYAQRTVPTQLTVLVRKYDARSVQSAERMAEFVYGHFIKSVIRAGLVELNEALAEHDISTTLLALNKAVEF